MLNSQAAPGGYAGSILGGILKLTGQCSEKPGMIFELTLLCGGGWTRQLLVPSSPDCAMVLFSDQQPIAVQWQQHNLPPVSSTRCCRTLCSHSKWGSPVIPWHTNSAMGPLGEWSTPPGQCEFQLKYSFCLIVDGWSWHCANER